MKYGVLVAKPPKHVGGRLISFKLLAEKLECVFRKGPYEGSNKNSLNGSSYYYTVCFCQICKYEWRNAALPSLCRGYEGFKT